MRGNPSPPLKLPAPDDELWNWAQYRAKQLGKESVSQYLFDLIKEDKKKTKA